MLLNALYCLLNVAQTLGSYSRLNKCSHGVGKNCAWFDTLSFFRKEENKGNSHANNSASEKKECTSLKIS